MSSRRKTPTFAPTSALDQSLAALARNDAEQALRWAVPALEDVGAGAPALDLVGRSLSVLGERALAVRAFAAGARALALQGIATHAVAAALSAMKLDGQDLLPALAASLGAEGEPEDDPAVAPPPLQSEDVRAVPSSVNRKALCDQASRAVERLSRALPEALPPRRRRSIWSTLPPGAFERFARTLTIRLVPEGTAVVREGEAGESAFVVARGEVEVTRAQDARSLAVLGADAVFGELALLTRAPRGATVSALRPTLLLEMSRDAVREAVTDVPALGALVVDFCHRRLVQNVLRASPILSAVPPSQRGEVVGLFTARALASGEVVIAEGERHPGLHLLASGRVEVRRLGPTGESETLATLGPGECVGEVSLVLRRPAMATVVALEPGVALVLSPERFLTVAREHPELLSTLYQLAVARTEEAEPEGRLSVVGVGALTDDDVVVL